VKGQSGNPGGRPVGARNKLQGDFCNALAADFAEHGKRALEAARNDDPMGYIKVVASLMPKQVEPTKALENLTDDELTAGIDFLRSHLVGRAGEGSGDAQAPESPAHLSTVQ
jgi:hypothetical protein